MKRIISCVIALTLLASLGLAGGCAEAPSVTTTLPAGKGRIEVRVTDLPPEYGEIEAIWVTVEEEGVMVYKAATEEDGDGEWIPILISGDNPFELLALQEVGVDALLGWGAVDPGKYTQIKMTISEVKIYFEGKLEPILAELPSGKLKFVRPFEVVDGGTTIIMLDFIADKSVVITGAKQSDDFKVIFKPVVKLLVFGKGKPIDELGYSLEATEESGATAEQSEGEARSGSESVHLDTGTEGAGVEARIVIPLPAGTKLGDIESISWWEYLVQGYPPHVDMFLDVDKDGGPYEGYPDDDVLVFEYAYNTTSHYGEGGPTYGAETGAWHQTFSDDLNGPAQVDDTASAWPGSGPPGPPGSIELRTLAEWKTGITYTTDATKTVDLTTPVLYLEIEIDNWILQTEAYVDDIKIVIGGVTYTIDI